jgi:uncharacterized protein YbjT (DUF2867 family)
VEQFTHILAKEFAPGSATWSAARSSAARDVAAVAARVLLADGHMGKAYDVTGPEALSHADAMATSTPARQPVQIGGNARRLAARSGPLR